MSVFDFYFCFFFFAVTVVPIRAPPLMNSNAIHSVRLLLSAGLGRLRIVRQFYRYGVGFFDFLGAVFVTVILIAAVAVTILQQP